MFNDHCKWFLGASSILVIFPSTSLGSKICTFLKIDFREEGGGEREKNTDLLFHLFMHSLVDSYMCPDQGSNPQPWYIGTMLQPTELSGQG